MKTERDLSRAYKKLCWAERIPEWLLILSLLIIGVLLLILLGDDDNVPVPPPVLHTPVIYRI